MISQVVVAADSVALPQVECASIPEYRPHHAAYNCFETKESVCRF